MPRRGPCHAPSTDGSRGVRASAASNPACRRETLQALLPGDSDDANLEIVAAIAANPSTDPHLLATIAESSTAELRGRVASNPALSERLFAVLAADNDPWVREKSATNRACPRHLLAALLTDHEQVVRKAAQNTLVNVAAS